MAGRDGVGSEPMRARLADGQVRLRVRRRRTIPVAWLGAGVVFLGLGAAMASGTGTAHADTASAHTGRSASAVGSASSVSRRSGKTAPQPRPKPASPAVIGKAVPGVITGFLSAFGLNSPTQPANPLSAVAWVVLRTVETRFGLTPVAGTPTVGTPDHSSGTVTGTMGFTEPAGQPLTYSVAADPALGTVALTSGGAFTYTPSVGTRTATTDSFTVTASDGLAATSESVTVPVAAQTTSAATTVSVPSGLTINLIWDPSVAKAPASFKATVQQAAQLLEATVTNTVTVNIAVGYGEIGGTPIGSGSAEGATLADQQESYDTLKSQLAVCDTTTIGQSVVAHLPAANPFGSLTYDVSGAQLKVFGVDPANSTQLDGEIGFSTDWPSADLLAAALHEMTHAMGRNSGWGSAANGYDVTALDLSRYSAPGVLVCDGSAASTAHLQYFSVDGGATVLADYSTTSDYGDWAANSLTATDPFDAYTESNSNALTTVDVAVLDAIGYTT